MHMYRCIRIYLDTYIFIHVNERVHTRARRYAYLVTAGEDTRIFGEHSVAPVARRRSGD
jgi:hypothetical protein